MSGSKRYYTLLLRDNASSPWVIDFGDYDRSIVRAELQDVLEHKDHFLENTKIIKTYDEQMYIQAEVDRLNANVG